MRRRKRESGYLINKFYFRIQVWLPKGEIWYNVFTRERIDGQGTHQTVDVTIDTFGLFARGGSIIPINNVGP